MNPTDWMTHSLRKATRWMTGVMCCLPLLAGAAENDPNAEALRRGAKATAETKQRLAATIIPRLSFKDTSIDEAAATLRKELLGPDREYPAAVYPVQFVVRRSYGFQPKSVTLELKDVSAATAIDKVADLAGMTAAVNLTLITFWPKPEALEKAKATAFEAAGFKPDGVTPIDAPPAQDAESRSSLSEMSHRLDATFAWVRSATLRASLLAGVIVSLQLLLGRLMPPRWRYALWAPLLLVLVLPVLPKVPFGLFPEKSPVSSAEVVSSPAPSADGLSNPTPPTVVPTASTPPLWKANPYALIWLTGTVAVLALGFAGYRRNLRRIMENRVEADDNLLQAIERAAGEVRLAKVPRVIVSTAVPSPAVTGLLRPSLLLPADLAQSFNAAEVRLILVHELTHLKRHDLPVNWLCCILQALHWFNPVLWFAFARMREDREAACDAQVLSLDGNDHRSAYGHALLKLQSATVAPALHLGFVGIFERNAGLKSRIREISRHRAAHPAWHVASMGLIALLFAFGATQAQEPRRKEQAAEGAKAKDPRQVTIEKKLDGIVIPVVDFENTSLEEAIDFLRIRSVELDKTETEATKKGINFVIRKPRGGKEEFPRIASLRLNKVTLRQALTQIEASTKTRFKVDAFAVTFVPASEAEAEAPAGKAKAPGKALVDASKIIIPVLDFQDTTLAEGLDFIRLRAPGVNIVLGPGAKKDAVIPQLSLRNVPTSEALRYIAEAVKQPLSADDTVIRIGE